MQIFKHLTKEFTFNIKKVRLNVKSALTMTIIEAQHARALFFRMPYFCQSEQKSCNKQVGVTPACSHVHPPWVIS